MFIKMGEIQRGNKYEQGCTSMAIIGRCICFVVRELNLVPCDSYMDRLCLLFIHSLFIKREVTCHG